MEPLEPCRGIALRRRRTHPGTDEVRPQVVIQNGLIEVDEAARSYLTRRQRHGHVVFLLQVDSQTGSY